MIALNSKDDESGVLDCKNIVPGILKSASIFGPNSSGKSYLFKALDSLKRIVRAGRDGPMPDYYPFRLSEKCLDAPIRLSLRLLIENLVYEYSVEYDRNSILSESLYHSPNGRRTPVFLRGRAGDNMDPVVKERLTSSTAYLTIAPGYNYPICGKVLREIQKIMVIYQSYDSFVEESYGIAMRDSEIKRMMESGLDAADLVKGFFGEEHTVPARRGMPGDGAESNPYTYVDIQLIHSFKDADVNKKMLTFPLNIESNGTVEMFSIMGPIAKALKEGDTLIIDEFGSNLHPILTRWIVGLFNYESNDNGAQLIVNTHDMGLMDIEDVFRRDQIWFTNKDRSTGSCRVYALSDFKGIRKGANIRKDYLYGRYDAIPYVVGVRKL
jgi:hypothetical protein